MRKHRLGRLHLLNRWRALRYSVDHCFQKCCVRAWQSCHRFRVEMGAVITWSGSASSGRPIRKWPGVSWAIPSSSFESSDVKRGLELRQASIWHKTVVISSKVSLLSPTIRFRWRLQALTPFSQTEPWWGPVGGMNFHWMPYAEQKFIIDSCEAGCLTHWRLNEIACDPPLIPWRVLDYFRAIETKKINHMCSNHRHKIRFQDLV